MPTQFIRKHHLLTALLLLSAAAILYVVGFSAGAVLLVAVAVMLEIVGWILVFTRTPARQSER